jgi:acetyl esterase/lipase
MDIDFPPQWIAYTIGRSICRYGGNMTTRHLVAPDLLPMLDELPTRELGLDTLPQTRLRAEIQRQANQPLPELELTEHHVPGSNGAPDVRALVYYPKRAARPIPALFWIHGGGYIMGLAEMEPGLQRVIAAINCAAVSVYYRLAPETPFPGSVDDCYSALKWLQANAVQLGVDGNRIAIGGASAGGGLAAGLCLMMRDRSDVQPVFQLLVFPMLDDRTVTTNKPHPYTGEYVWTPDSNRFGRTCYLGQEPGSPGISPYAAAARAEPLEGLPPTFIVVGTLDLFLEEDLEYARRLIREGVPTELHVYPGAYHGFTRVSGAWMTQATRQGVTEALQRALQPSHLPL